MTPGPTRHPVFRYLRAALGPRGTGVADAELVRRFVASRDEAAFELLMWRHAAMVLRVCRGVLPHAADVDDAFQAVFLALARKATALRRHESIAAWLHRAALHAALRVRAQSLRQANCVTRELVRRPASDPERPDEAAVRRELVPLLHEELGRLSAKYRSPVLLCCFEGHTLAEAAQRLGWPVGTVAGRLARARDLLRQRLARRGVTLSVSAVAVMLAAGPAPAVSSVLIVGTARIVAGAPASSAVLALTEGVLHAMTVVKLKLATAIAVAAVLAVTGGALVSGQRPDPNLGGGSAAAPTAIGQTPTGSGVAASTGSAPQRPTAAANVDDRSLNNLKQIVLACQNYLDANGHFPNIYCDEQGQPTLSWRVAILPYIEQTPLFNQFHLDEPWDSPHNKPLLARMPDIFRTSSQRRGSTDTFYQGFTGHHTMFERGRDIGIANVTDGTSNTIMVVEGGPPVPWTKPVDVVYSATKPLPRLEGPFRDVLHVAMADGSAHTLMRPFEGRTFRAAITRDGGEVSNLDELKVPLQPPPRGGPAYTTPPVATAGGGGVGTTPPGDMRRADDLAQLRKDVDQLREQVRQLQAEVDRLKGRGKTSAPPSLTP